VNHCAPVRARARARMIKDKSQRYRWATCCKRNALHCTINF